MKKFVLAVAVSLALATAISAQDQALNPGIGAEVVPRGELQAKSSPPSAFAFWGADTTTTISPPTVYVVRDVATVSSILPRERYYLLVEESSGEGPCQRAPCWVYQGVDSSDLEPNLVIER